MKVFFIGLLLVSALSYSFAGSFSSYYAGNRGHGYPTLSRRFMNTANNRLAVESPDSGVDAVRDQYISDYVNKLSPQDKTYMNNLNQPGSGQIPPQQINEVLPQQSNNQIIQPQQQTSQSKEDLQPELIDPNTGDQDLRPLPRMAQTAPTQQGFNIQQATPQQRFPQQSQQWYPSNQQGWNNQRSYPNQPIVDGKWQRNFLQMFRMPMFRMPMFRIRTGEQYTEGSKT